MIEMTLWNEDRTESSPPAQESNPFTAGIFLGGAIQAALQAKETVIIEVVVRP